MGLRQRSAMAGKDAKAVEKRKAASGAKGKPDGKAKKARLDDSTGSEPSKTDDGPKHSKTTNGGPKRSKKTKDGPKPSEKADAASKTNSFDRNGLTSRESHAKQKQLAQERRAAKPLADEVYRTKKLWERLRRKSHVPKEERRKLVDELFGIITGRCRDFVLKHDAVRAVQTAIKYSTPDQRRQIARELEGSYAHLAESRYAKFLIGKLLVHDDDEIRDLVLPNFYGKVRKLINHAEASWILDDIYRTVATKEQKAMLLREWYGPEFALREMTKDAKPMADLKQMVSDEPSKRGPIMKSLLELINSLVQKKMTGFTMLHDAMLQYFVNTQAGTDEFSEFVELVKGDESGDLLRNMAFTKSGARLVCLLLAHGTSKDRKQLLKAYRDTFLFMAGDAYAHVVMLTAYDVIDDTKLVSKSVFPELLGAKDEEIAQNVVGAANNAQARTTMLYLFDGPSKPLFPASHDWDLAVLDEVREIRKTTSKKDDEVRRRELVAALAPQLLAAIAEAPLDLTSTAFGCQFVADVLLSEVDGKAKALGAVAQAAGGDPKREPGSDDATARLHISRTSFGGRMLKSLIQGGRFDKGAGKMMQVEPPLGFADVLYPVIRDYVVDWATGPSSFVVVAMVEAGDFGEANALKKTLRKNRKLLERAAAKATAEQKVQGGRKGKKADAVGNTGSRLLLEKL